MPSVYTADSDFSFWLTGWCWQLVGQAVARRGRPRSSSGSCSLLVSPAWRCFDFCVVGRLDIMPRVQLAPKKHGSSLLRWSKDFIKKCQFSAIARVLCGCCFTICFRKKNHQLLGGWIVLLPWGLPTSYRATIPLPPTARARCRGFETEVLGSRKKNVNVWLSDGSWSECISIGG